MLSLHKACGCNRWTKQKQWKQW